MPASDFHRDWSTGKRRKIWIFMRRMDEGQAAMWRELVDLTGAVTGDMPACVVAFPFDNIPMLRNPQ